MNLTIYIMVVTIIASGVGTLSGFGAGTIMTPLLLLYVPFEQAILIIAIIHWFHNIWKISFFKEHINWRLGFYFGIPSMIGSFVGAVALIRGNGFLVRGFGLFLILYALWLLINPEFTIKRSLRVAIVGGIVTGFFAGIFGIRGAIKAVFLSAFNLPKKMYIATMGIISVVIDTTRLITYSVGGLVLNAYFVKVLILCIPASFVGALLGRASVSYVSQKAFRLIIAFLLFLSGIRFVFFAS